MKKFFKYSLCFLMGVSLLFLIVECDRFDLEFTTRNNFTLDSSAYEFDVMTKQEGPFINTITIDGKVGPVALGYVIEDKIVTYDYDGYSVVYINGSADEIKGDWFNVKVVDSRTIHILISENNESVDRGLVLRLVWRSASNIITINQNGK